MGTWPQKAIADHIAFMHSLNKDLSEAGELVAAEGLADPKQAVIVRVGKNGEPVTDGVFPESKEFLAGYWIVDVESEKRAHEIAAQRLLRTRPRWQAVRHSHRSPPGHGRLPRAHRIGQPPWHRIVDIRTEHLLRDLAPQVLGVLLHRFRDFSAAEDAVQESLIAAANQWPHEGLRTIRAPGSSASPPAA